MANIDKKHPSDQEVCKLILVDDHPIVLQGLAQILEYEDDLEVCGTATSIAEALEACSRLKPDVALVDLTLGDDSGIRLIEEMAHDFPDVKVIVLSMHDEMLYGERCLKSGAKGYVMKQDPPETVIDAIRIVMKGDRFISHNLKEKLLERFIDKSGASDASPVEVLSARELEVFEFLGHGLSPRQIAEKISLSVKTIENYIENIKGKFNLKSSREVLIHAIKWMLLKDNPQ